MPPAFPLTRFAPTPSGYLHLGNLANFLLVERLARARGGSVLLRIDDCDGTRARAEFVEHIFETLRWLGLAWEHGPQDAEDFYRGYSQTKRREHYRARLGELKKHVYACACSRREYGAVYPGTCRHRNLPFEPGVTALRLRVDEPTLAARFGDVVLWRKDDGPAYHWASVVDDLEWKVRLIVRGEDLAGSSELQKYIAKLVTPGEFEGVDFVHHPLLNDAEGQKLSKSLGAHSVVELRAEGLSPVALRERIGETLRSWGY